jgi:hypothetical protein
VNSRKEQPLIRKPSSRHTFHIIAHFFGFVNTFFHFFSGNSRLFSRFWKEKRPISRKIRAGGSPCGKAASFV